MARERNKPTESWIERAKNELANEKELTIARAYELGRIRGHKEAVEKAKEWLSKQGKNWWDGYGLPFSLTDFETNMNKLWEEKK